MHRVISGTSIDGRFAKLIMYVFTASLVTNLVVKNYKINFSKRPSMEVPDITRCIICPNLIEIGPVDMPTSFCVFGFWPIWTKIVSLNPTVGHLNN